MFSASVFDTDGRNGSAKVTLADVDRFDSFTVDIKVRAKEIVTVVADSTSTATVSVGRKIRHAAASAKLHLDQLSSVSVCR